MPQPFAITLCDLSELGASVDPILLAELLELELEIRRADHALTLCRRVIRGRRVIPLSLGATLRLWERELERALCRRGILRAHVLCVARASLASGEEASRA